MMSRPFKCGARLPDGRKCDALAVVTDAEHIHHDDFAEGGFEQIVDEIRYTMECPRCGPWKRIESMHLSRELCEV
jgi:hypothetical protein